MHGENGDEDHDHHGNLANGMNAPARTGKSPRSLTIIVVRASNVGVGMCRASRIVANESGPRASFAYPCCMKPTINRRRDRVLSLLKGKH
jgi:hypothetical protein